MFETMQNIIMGFDISFAYKKLETFEIQWIRGCGARSGGGAGSPNNKMWE